MKINEIRIGNILKAKENGKWNTVCVSATFNTFVIAKNKFLHIGNTYDADQLHGAYMSTEWLLENGFEDMSGVGREFSFPSTQYCMKDIVLVTSNGGSSFFVVSVANGGRKTMSEELRSIHQLQNLFFAITGSELLTPQSTMAILAVSAPAVDTYTESES